MSAAVSPAVQTGCTPSLMPILVRGADSTVTLMVLLWSFTAFSFWQDTAVNATIVAIAKIFFILSVIRKFPCFIVQTHKKKDTLEKDDPIVFVLWGSAAKSKKALLTNKAHKIVESAHPSPLSYYKGFKGSKPFSKVNNLLKSVNKEEIRW